MTTPPAPKPAAEKLRVLVDTREQLPLEFNPERVVAVRATLATGDYSLEGYQDAVSIERKSVPDLVQCLTWERERFWRELERLRAMPFAAVLVEGDWRDLVAHKFQSQASTQSIVASVMAIQTRFCPVMFASDHRHAALYVEQLLSRWLRDLQANATGGAEDFTPDELAAILAANGMKLSKYLALPAASGVKP